MSLSGPGSQLPGAARKGSESPLTQPLSVFGSKRLNQFMVDPANLSGGFTPKPPDAPTLPVAPVVEAPPVMPLADDKAIQMQQRKSMAALVKSRGRASTILTSDGSLGTAPQSLGSS